MIKHADNGDTQIETPEAGAEFSVYLKKSGSYDAAMNTERDYLICDKNGYAETKSLPYGVYTVHQVKGTAGSELLPDFDVFICEDGQIYRYLANNARFRSYLKIVKAGRGNRQNHSRKRRRLSDLPTRRQLDYAAHYLPGADRD